MLCCQMWALEETKKNKNTWDIFITMKYTGSMSKILFLLVENLISFLKIELFTTGNFLVYFISMWFFSLMTNWENKVICHSIKKGVKNNHSLPYTCSFLLLVFKLYSLYIWNRLMIYPVRSWVMHKIFKRPMWTVWPRSTSLFGPNYLLKSSGLEDHLWPRMTELPCWFSLRLPFLLKQNAHGSGAHFLWCKVHRDISYSFSTKYFKKWKLAKRKTKK